MTGHYYLGVDPGVTGGLALLMHDGTALSWLSMPDGEAGIVMGVRKLMDTARARHTVGDLMRFHGIVERVHASPQMGVSSAFTFGRNKGAVLAALAALDVPVDEVTPVVWQKAMGVIYPKGEKRDKNVSKRRAAQLFPSLTIYHHNADALLIAEYGRRLHCGMLKREHE